MPQDIWQAYGSLMGTQRPRAQRTEIFASSFSGAFAPVGRLGVGPNYHTDWHRGNA